MSAQQYCPECGQENESQGKFCSGCGSSFDSPEGTGVVSETKPVKKGGMWKKALLGISVVFGFFFVSVFVTAYQDYLATANAAVAKAKADQASSGVSSSSLENQYSLSASELQIADELKNGVTDRSSKAKISDTISVQYQPDPLGAPATCWVNVKSPTHHRFDLTYQYGKEAQEAIYGASSLAEGASFRLKGDSSSRVYTLSSRFGAEKVGMSVDHPEFDGLIGTFYASKSVKVDYGQGSLGSTMVDEFNVDGFQSGLKIAIHLCG